ncbi:hypothetical protein MCUN1_003219 [Malassezia cuniculi]|uniref:Anaphase-promoting complex subunit 4-like WD40 domain-containing protein n=1 Tax=Malassezia cuniculi TaxID=948313 RepID=A0AAF0ET83_9BASI|nr:hypothetical protein MCUN1_003219 [Malassezia cuniculi]
MPRTFGSRSKANRPKSGMRSSSNTLISRVSVNAELRANFNQRTDTTVTFFHSGKSLFWYANSYAALKEPVVRVLFASAPLCHDVNQVTSSQDAIDLLIGFETGDILWIDAVGLRYNRINKGGAVTRSAVRQVRWLPGSETQFITAHQDGSILLWDRDAEDGQFSLPAADAPHMPVHRSEDKTRNPQSVWRVSSQPITEVAFAPDGQQLAIVCEDGLLRLVDMATESLTCSFKSYFGSLTCVCWSVDGRILATGGQDDLVTLWSPHERRIIARAQGHSSFVSGIVADPWRSSGDTYRFVSIGQDANVCIWDFSPALLTRPARNARTRMSNTEHVFSPSNGVYDAPGRALVPVLQPIAIGLTGSNRLCDVRVSETGFLFLHRDSQLDLYSRPSAQAEPAPQMSRSFSIRASTLFS